MKTFLEYLEEEQRAGFIRGAGADAPRQITKYVDPHLTKSRTAEPSHTLGKAHPGLAIGARLRLHKKEEIKGKMHVHATDESGGKHVVPVAKLHKPGTKTENEGHKFENHTIERLKSVGIMPKDAKGAGSTAGTDFLVHDKNKEEHHKGRVTSTPEPKAIYNGETKSGTTAAMGQITIHHDKKKGWHIPDEARAKRPKYAAALEATRHPESGLPLLQHLNKHHHPDKVNATASGRAPSVVVKHPNMDPANSYLEDHHVDVVHVGSGYGTYKVGKKDKTGHGLPGLKGKGKWTVREKQAGNKNARTVMFQPDGKKGLEKSHVNVDHDEHLHALAKTLGHEK